MCGALPAHLKAFYQHLSRHIGYSNQRACICRFNGFPVFFVRMCKCSFIHNKLITLFAIKQLGREISDGIANFHFSKTGPRLHARCAAGGRGSTTPPPSVHPPPPHPRHAPRRQNQPRRVETQQKPSAQPGETKQYQAVQGHDFDQLRLFHADPLSARGSVFHSLIPWRR